jgi:hypothetical protein
MNKPLNGSLSDGFPCVKYTIPEMTGQELRGISSTL